MSFPSENRTKSERQRVTLRIGDHEFLCCCCIGHSCHGNKFPNLEVYPQQTTTRTVFFELWPTQGHDGGPEQLYTKEQLVRQFWWHFMHFSQKTYQLNSEHNDRISLRFTRYKVWGSVGSDFQGYFISPPRASSSSSRDFSGNLGLQRSAILNTTLSL